MRLLVTGGRDFNDMDFVFSVLDNLHRTRNVTVLMHGGARGADRLAGMWGLSRGVVVEVYPANWKEHGLAAGPIRNQEMLDAGPDLLVAFPGGRGTADMVRRARQAGLEVIEAQAEGDQQ